MNKVSAIIANGRAFVRVKGARGLALGRMTPQEARRLGDLLIRSADSADALVAIKPEPSDGLPSDRSGLCECGGNGGPHPLGVPGCLERERAAGYFESNPDEAAAWVAEANARRARAKWAAPAPRREARAEPHPRPEGCTWPECDCKAPTSILPGEGCRAGIADPKAWGANVRGHAPAADPMPPECAECGRISGVLDGADLCPDCSPEFGG